MFCDRVQKRRIMFSKNTEVTQNFQPKVRRYRVFLKLYMFVFPFGIYGTRIVPRSIRVDG
jgi:hypothetical protein